MARKILLADDSVTAQNMGRKILADAGYEVLTVNNGSAALKKIAEGKPDLIVLDVYMPGYSGLEVCQRLKEGGDTARIPVLLTVGKLEPFKPEEARRVRAEGFIIKPFEASELLSALSKLEDKIVPRAESSKPGRFARAIAAVEEGRRDPVVSGGEDSSWKDRITFPSKKKESRPQEADDDDAPIYNPVNKDLRTVIASDPKPATPESKPKEDRVDLGALAHQGLPKDVTAEEIAALAAAAAQMKGTIPTDTATESSDASARIEEFRIARDETRSVETKNDIQDGESVKEHGGDLAAAPPAATPGENQKPAIADEAPLAVAAHPPAEVVTSAEKSSGNGSSSFPVESEPVTIAAAASEFRGTTLAGTSFATTTHDGTRSDGTRSGAARSRWIAVPAALLPDEAAISLELELQRSFAAAAAAGTTSVAAYSRVEPSAPPSEADVPSLPETALSPAAEVPEGQPMSAAASAAIDAIGHAVKEFETVAASLAEAPAPAPSKTESAETESAKTESAAGAAEPSGDSSIETPGISHDAVEKVLSNEPAGPLPDAAPVAAAVPAIEATSEPSTEETPTPASINVSSVNQSPEISEAPQSGEPSGNGPRSLPEKESEMAEATAAAWASWRRVRESKDESAAPAAESAQVARPESSAQKDEAAMAVAAGAEKAPDAAPSESESDDPAEIASIVDSVLADLRPKIVAEISRKLGKKK